MCGAAARVVPLLLSLVPMLYVPPPSADDARGVAAAVARSRRTIGSS